MLKRLQHHINVKIKRLLDQMILGTIILLVVGFGLILTYALTQNGLWLGLLWILGLVYAVFYFADAIRYSNIVRDLDQDSLDKSIWISKAYFRY